MNCKNCYALVNGKYCSECGQSSNVGKITLPHLLRDLSNNVFQVNRGFLFTMKELMVRPGQSIKEYLLGRRKKYTKPITYVLALSTLYFLLSQLSEQNTWMDDLLTGWSRGAYDSGDGDAVPAIMVWFATNFAYTTLLLLPVFSLASYLSFLRSGKNYFEHVVINSYTTGQQALFYSLFVLFRTFVDSKVLEVFPFVIAVSYVIWVFWEVFQDGNRMINVLRSILTYILYFIFCGTLLIIVMGISEFIC